MADTPTDIDIQKRAATAICTSLSSGAGKPCRDTYSPGSWCEACLLHGMMDQLIALRAQLATAEREKQQAEQRELASDGVFWKLVADGIKHHPQCAEHFAGDKRWGLCQRCQREQAERERDEALAKRTARHCEQDEIILPERSPLRQKLADTERDLAAARHALWNIAGTVVAIQETASDVTRAIAITETSPLVDEARDAIQRFNLSNATASAPTPAPPAPVTPEPVK